MNRSHSHFATGVATQMPELITNKPHIKDGVCFNISPQSRKISAMFTAKSQLLEKTAANTVDYSDVERNGSLIVNTEPSPGRLSTSNRPPCAITI